VKAVAHNATEWTANSANRKVITQDELDVILDNHKKWLDRCGKHGDKDQADLSFHDLQGLSLGGASLKSANLSRTNLSGLDFRDVELCDADLWGAILRETDLVHAKGLVERQLSGTDLSDAALPSDIGEFPLLKQVSDTSSEAKSLLLTTIGLCLFALITLFVTADTAILAGSGSTLLPLLQINIPVFGFFLIMPLVLLGMYFNLHFHLQFLWNELALLPSIFPNGSKLDERAGPLFLICQARRYKPILDENQPSLDWLQSGASVLSAWCVVPITLFLFWLRYLRMHDIWVIWHIFLFTVGTGFGVASYNLAVQTLGGKRNPGLFFENEVSTRKRTFATNFPWAFGAMIAAAFFCAFISVAAFSGWTAFSDGLRRWTCADISYGQISYKPSDGQHSSETKFKEAKEVRGALLMGINLSGAKAFETFLANADLTDANLSQTDLSGADLRNTWLINADLHNATLVNAKLGRANLTRANLQCAELRGSEFPSAILSSAKLKGANLYNAKLPCAMLNGAQLQCDQACCGVPLQKRQQDCSKTTLCSAELQHANLESAWLEGADLGYAQLEQARLTQAQLNGAKLECANLTNANLAGARLWETWFKDADFSGAWFQDTELHGADLSEAKNLDHDQIAGAYCDDKTKLPPNIRDREKCKRRERTPWNFNNRTLN
jgi:uncharacterized protein YjbI with pentapeptide repeats